MGEPTLHVGTDADGKRFTLPVDFVTRTAAIADATDYPDGGTSLRDALSKLRTLDLLAEPERFTYTLDPDVAEAIA